MNSKTLVKVLKAVFACAFVAALFAASMASYSGASTWHHALKGKEFMKDMAFPKADTLSYTGEAKWDKSAWLFDLFTYSAAYAAGMNRLGYFKFLFFLLIALMIYLTVYRKQQGRYISITIPIGLLGLLLINYYLKFEPQAFSMIFAAYFLYVLEQDPSKRNAPLYYTLPFISLIWANMDVTAPAGTFLIFIYILYYIVDMAEMPEKKEKYNSPAILIAFAASAGASLLTPSFTGQYTSLIMNFSAGQASWLEFIKGGPAEIRQAILLGFYLFTYIFVLAVNERGSDVGRKSELVRDVMTALIFIAACAADISYAPVFIIVTLPTVMYYAYLIFRWSFVWPKQWTETNLARVKNFLYLALIPLVLVYGAYKFTEPKRKLLPDGAIAYIMNAKPPKNLFTPIYWTGYTGYYLPSYKSMWDGNPLRNQDVKREYDIFFKGTLDITPIIERHGINTFLLPLGSGLENRLKGMGYKAAYFDDSVIVRVNPAAAADYLKYINPSGSGDLYDRTKYDEALAELKEFSIKYPSVRSHSLTARMILEKNRKLGREYLENIITDFPEEYPLYNTLGRLYYEEGELNSAMDIWEQSKEPDAGVKQLMNTAAARLKKNEE